MESRPVHPDLESVAEAILLAIVYLVLNRAVEGLALSEPSNTCGQAEKHEIIIIYVR